ncbi:hypothetical protein [Methylorubrum podarium]|uniref:hypothetical protein n=1 Tax=Methylorubrum podarium TaxID=200476 RepID=UPI001EE1AFB2|nr:hypothetical protein [Methylorubrum podarium]GJE72158.1 hypothetical protein CHKEEEPN_3712 [Methylorubrum podarium]
MFRLADVARTIDPENSAALLNDLRNWFARGVLHYTVDPAEGVEPDQPASKPGSPGLLSRHRVIQVAITVHLVRLGLPPKEAAHIAGSFSDVSTPPRLPGMLFPRGETVLAVWRRGAGPFERRVLNPDPRETARDLSFRVAGSAGLPPALITINCGDLLRSLEPLIGPSPAYPV